MPDARPDARPGTYALVLRTTVTAVVAIGRRHALPLTPGWLVYAGSAFGPGGVAARAISLEVSQRGQRCTVSMIR